MMVATWLPRAFALVERLAETLPDRDDDRPQQADRTLAESAPIVPAEIGPSLLAEKIVPVLDRNGRAESIFFGLSGSCVPFASVRRRYPKLLVINRSHGRSELEWNTFGVHVGNAVIGFWFQGLAFDCMRRVDITPADATLSRLTLD
ncbi:hypothetical protein [Stenotrophomonas sp. CFBP 13725]|uniref:hypothetical protein n=1 Tax=Stenotrophomonas sp. CFBP 13725 TaxID=2775297 RepID=UPI001781A5E2|nr:hypothetical protein [Stenotrophomonas sp. CFBP 13725]MBD8635647.1 hypothetical protein [Stenotrophomonas sp. CFBP 13725]